MSTHEINEFYNRQIAPLSPADQLLLANQIFERVAGSTPDPFAGEDSSVVAARQRAALKSACGMFRGSPADASLLHDEIVYDEPVS